MKLEQPKKPWTLGNNYESIEPIKIQKATLKVDKKELQELRKKMDIVSQSINKLYKNYPDKNLYDFIIHIELVRDGLKNINFN